MFIANIFIEPFQFFGTAQYTAHSRRSLLTADRPAVLLQPDSWGSVRKARGAKGRAEMFRRKSGKPAPKEKVKRFEHVLKNMVSYLDRCWLRSMYNTR